MISERFSEDVFIADFSNYVGKPTSVPVPYRGVVVGTNENGIIPSFVIHNENRVPFKVVNNEHNPSVFKRKDGTQEAQCECIAYSERNDNRKGWLFFLELKYCESKNRYVRMLEGISQLKETCSFIFRQKRIFDEKQFKKYLIISTPGVEPLEPFAEFYFDQDYMLSVQEETGALLRAANEVFVKTSAVLIF